MTYPGLNDNLHQTNLPPSPKRQHSWETQWDTPEGQVRKCPIPIPPKRAGLIRMKRLFLPPPQEPTKWCAEPVGSGQTRLNSPGLLLEGTLDSSLSPRPANLYPESRTPSYLPTSHPKPEIAAGQAEYHTSL